MDKESCDYIIDTLIAKIEQKWGTIIEKPIFVERKIEVLVPKCKEIDLNKVGLLRSLWRWIF